MSSTVLVTGGAGYVGSHACKGLARHGYVPVTVDNLARGHREAVRWGPLVEADIRDRGALERAFAVHRPVAVLHFAAFTYVGESVGAPADYYGNNLQGTLSLLDTMRGAGCEVLVFSSTCATYGAPRASPIAETHPQQPVNPYGWSKLMSEQFIRDYARAYRLRYATLRYFNAAGADREGEIGEHHDPETHLIPLAIGAALDHARSLAIYGTDYPTPDGTAVRDYVHVDDLAEVHVLALRALVSGRPSMELNVGTGHGYSVREVVREVERATGSRIDARTAPRRAGDPPALVADTALATSTLGWTPRRSDLESIVATALRWHASRAGQRH